jgi:hypothetical protein
LLCSLIPAFLCLFCCSPTLPAAWFAPCCRYTRCWAQPPAHSWQ